MANPYLILWCDPTLNRIYTGWQQNTQALTPILKQGDNIGVELHWVQGTTGTTNMSEIVFPPSADAVLAVGRIDTAPTAGTYRLTYGLETTDALDFDATATEIQTALNLLTNITAEGGVIVIKSGNAYRVTWVEKGIYVDDLTVDTLNLSPTSDSLVVQLKEGTIDTNRVLMFSQRQAPIGAITSFTTTPEPTITVESIFANTWRVTISPSPRTGTFTLSQTVGVTTTTTTPLSVGASASQVATALNQLLAGYNVTKTGGFVWDITAPETVINITADSAVVGFSSLYGTLNLNTAECEEFLSGLSSASAYLEVELTISGEKQTLIQTQVTVINDLISNSSFTLVDMGDVMPIDSVVRWDTPQALTAPQQLQARDNIDAASNGDIASLEAADIVIDGRLDLLEAVSFTTDEAAAIQGGDTPSSSNVFVTSSVLSSGLAGKAALVHYHIATDITDGTSFGRNLFTAPSAASQRSFLGLGTMATENTTSYLTITSAAATYLTIANATTDYVTYTYVAANLSPLFDQALNTTDTVSFAALTVASSGFSVGDGILSTTVGLASTWQISIQGGGLDTVLSWDGLNIGGTTGLTFSALGAKITFPSANTLDEVDNGGTVTTGGTGTTIKSDDYPEEIFITINGIQYAVPARVV